MKRCGELVGYVIVNSFSWPNPVVCGEGSEVYKTYKEAYRELKRARQQAGGDKHITMMRVVQPISRQRLAGNPAAVGTN